MLTPDSVLRRVSPATEKPHAKSRFGSPQAAFPPLQCLPRWRAMRAILPLSLPLFIGAPVGNVITAPGKYVFRPQSGTQEHYCRHSIPAASPASNCNIPEMHKTQLKFDACTDFAALLCSRKSSEYFEQSAAFISSPLTVGPFLTFRHFCIKGRAGFQSLPDILVSIQVDERTFLNSPIVNDRACAGRAVTIPASIRSVKIMVWALPIPLMKKPPTALAVHR